jgi:hypothetical protein
MTDQGPFHLCHKVVKKAETLDGVVIKHQQQVLMIAMVPPGDALEL